MNQDLRLRFWDVGFPDLGLRQLGLKHLNQGLGFRVYGLDLGFMVEASGRRAPDVAG